MLTRGGMNMGHTLIIAHKILVRTHILPQMCYHNKWLNKRKIIYMEWFYILLAVVAILVIAGIVIYNSLVTLKVRVDEAWSDITVQLKRRYDLIPNLVETVKGYAKHEAETLEKIAQERAAT